MCNNKISAIVIGSSTGGYEILHEILASLPAGFMPVVIIVQHMSEGAGSLMQKTICPECQLSISQVMQDENITSGHIYLAPPGSHTRITDDKKLRLDNGQKVNFCRPSIDVLFDSASRVFGKALLGIILSGANNDGAAGIINIHKAGGTTIVQKPASSIIDEMPLQAIKTGEVDFVLDVEEIIDFLSHIK